MSQSILQNGYAILLANSGDLDKALQAQDVLLRRIIDIKSEKTKLRDSSIQSRMDQINKIDGYISKLLIDGSDPDTADKYIALKAQLESQLVRISNQNVNATYDDIRKSHTFFINTTFKPIVSIAYGYSSVSTTPLPLFGSSTRIKIPIFGDFITDQAIRIRVSELRASHPDNRIRWYDFIGHRMIKEVRLVMDGLVLDRYGTEEMEMYYRFHVGKDQRLGWMRCVGQETPKIGTFLQDPEKQTVREKKVIVNGLQTQKNAHEETDLFIPLLFWFNLDPAFAISNWNITFDKFFVEIEFEKVENCVSVIDYAGDGGKYIAPSIIACDLITNHVYTTPEVAELFKHRTQFSIVRVHKRVDRILNKPFGMVNINDIKHAVESLYIRFRPTEHETNENAAELWRYNDAVTYRELRHASIISIAGTTSLAFTPIYYYDTKPTVDTVSFVSNGSTIYDQNPGVFYNSYIPMRFGRERIMTPSDEGAYLMTFSINPGEPQPSGYINFSQSRNQFIGYDSSYIDNIHQVNMSVSATCINFLVLMAGSISLRYAT